MSTTAQPNKQRGFVTIDNIVRSALFDKDYGMERYEKFKHFVIEGYQDFHFDLAAQVKTVELPLTDWKSAETPVDFVDWVIVGVSINNTIRAFTNDDRISLYQPDDDEDGFPDARDGDNSTPITDDTTQNSRIWFWDKVNQFGEDTGQMYGETVKFNGQGYFKWNSERREFQFNQNINGGTKIYLEYISNGINPCEATVVTPYAKKLLKLYAHWMNAKHAKSTPLWQIREAKADYWNEHFKVQSRIQKITVEDVLDCARDGYRLIGSV